MYLKEEMGCCLFCGGKGCVSCGGTGLVKLEMLPHQFQVLEEINEHRKQSKIQVEKEAATRCLICNGSGRFCYACNQTGRVSEDTHNQQLEDLERAKENRKQQCKNEERAEYLNKWRYEEEQVRQRVAVNAYWSDAFSWGTFNRFF